MEGQTLEHLDARLASALFARGLVAEVAKLTEGRRLSSEVGAMRALALAELGRAEEARALLGVLRKRATAAAEADADLGLDRLEAFWPRLELELERRAPASRAALARGAQRFVARISPIPKEVPK
jgi:hypothetical protein